MRQKDKPLLIISQSGRALVSSAVRAGLQALVIDRFSDSDTRSMAAGCLAVRGDENGIDATHLQSLLKNIPADSLAGVVIGSGLERANALIAELETGWPYYGNTAKTWESCNDPLAFSALLERLEIPFPEISLERVADPRNWLVKKKQASGGFHVRNVSEESVDGDRYFQKFIRGRHISVVFLADGSRFSIAGISDTAVVNREKGDFRYAGAVISANMSPVVELQLRDIIDNLVRHLSLCGLCGVDLVIDENDQCWLLELNPRPTSTFEMFEQEGSLLTAHISACHGKLAVLPTQMNIRGQQVIYAESAMQVPALDWPDWITDRPAAGKYINAGEPVCVIHAQGKDAEEVQRYLQERTSWTDRQFSKHYRAA